MTAINSNLSTFRPNTNKEKFSYSGSGQQTVQSINDISQATKKETVTAETLTLSAGAIGVTGKVRLTYAPIADSAGAKLGYFNTATDADTSVSITHTALAGDEVKHDLYLTDTQLYASLDNGDYLIDYIYGVIYYKKGHTDTAGTVDYKYTSQEIDLSVSSLTIGDVTSGGVTIASQTTAAIIAGDTTSVDDKTPALGTAAMAASSPVTIATDDTMITALDTALDIVAGDTTSIDDILTNVKGTDDAAAPSNNLNVGGVYNTADLSLDTGDNASLQLNDKGQLKVTGGASSVSAEYLSPNDFTATYTSTTTITLSSMPFTITDSSQIVYIKYIPTAGSDSAILVNGSSGVTITVSSNVVTVNGAATPFASGDVYEIGINGQAKSYDSSTQTDNVTVNNPIYAEYITESVVDTTDVAADTNYYPSSSGSSMDGYKNLSVTGKFIDGDGVITMTIEATNDEDATAANRDWISIYGYDAENDSTVNTFTVTNGTVTFAWDFDNLNYKYYRYVVVNNGATNTFIIKQRKSF